mgnify:CR=1 FL=1
MAVAENLEDMEVEESKEKKKIAALEYQVKTLLKRLELISAEKKMARPSEPGPNEPGPSEPGPSEPGPSEPGSTGPGPSRPSQPGPEKSHSQQVEPAANIRKYIFFIKPRNVFFKPQS